MDAEFVRIDGGHLLSLTRSQERQDEALSRLAGIDFKTTDWRENFVGFTVEDKNAKPYTYCWASKKLPVSNAVVKPKRGEQVRLKGYVPSMDAFGADKHDLWFYIQDLRVIKPVVEHGTSE